MPTQINGDRKVARGEMRHLGVPVAVRTAEAVDENDCRTASAGYDVVNEWHLWLVGLIVYGVTIARQRHGRNADDAEKCLCNCAILRARSS